jgi:hypothetical protein
MRENNHWRWVGHRRTAEFVPDKCSGDLGLDFATRDAITCVVAGGVSCRIYMLGFYDDLSDLPVVLYADLEHANRRVGDLFRSYAENSTSHNHPSTWAPVFFTVLD